MTKDIHAPKVYVVELEEGESMDCAGRTIWGKERIEVAEFPDGGINYTILRESVPFQDKPKLWIP